MAAGIRPTSTGAPCPRPEPLEGLRLGPLSFTYTHETLKEALPLFRLALGCLMTTLIYLAWVLHPAVTALVDVLTMSITTTGETAPTLCCGRQAAVTDKPCG